MDSVDCIHLNMGNNHNQIKGGYQFERETRGQKRNGYSKDSSE